MEVSVYYRGAMNKLRQIDAEVEHPNDAIEAVKELVSTDDKFAKPPFFALIKGGKQ